LRSPWFVLLLGMMGSTWSSAAYAYRHSSCNGEPYRWTQDVDFQLKACSAPPGTQKAKDVVYALDEWNAVGGMSQIASWETGDDVCAVRTGNRINEIGFVADDAIDGALGLTLRRYSGLCWDWTDHVDLVEADVFINGEVGLHPGSPTHCNRKQVGQRTTVLHELGHAIGLNHYDDAMALMLSSDGDATYCGSRMVTPHPDDAEGGRFLYSDGARSRDLAASTYYLAGPDRVELNSQPGIEALCPGEYYQVRWSVANLGTVDETYNVRWYLSVNKTITVHDLPIATNVNARQTHGRFSTWSRRLRMPRKITPGIYFVGHIVDYDNRVWEQRGGNNFTYMARKVRILSPSDVRCGQ